MHPVSPAPVSLLQPRDIYCAHLDIVHGCQLRCLGCPNSTLLPKIKRIAVEDFRKCLANIDVERIHLLRLFNFGEPLLHKQLSQIVALIPQQSWKAEIVEISTNGQQVYWDDFEQALKHSVITRLAVSCDGDGSPAEYERLRPPSKWEKFIEFLERTRELRDRWSPGLQLITRSVVESPQAMARWREILEPRGWAPEFRSWMALPESVQNMTHRKIQTPKGSCVFLAEPEEYTSHPWKGEIRLLYMDADGTVVPCCIHPRAGEFGNLMRQRYSEILRGELRARFKQQMSEDRSVMSICSQCEMGPLGNEGPTFHNAMAVEF